MRKIFFYICAVSALAACTKSEVQYEPAGEISLAPVASNVTKSVAGYDDDAFDGVFPTEIDLYVFANAGTGAAADHTEPYFKNAQFEWNSSKGTTDSQNGIATEGAYAGNPTRYWPNVKTLVFAGYSDACGVDKTAPTMDFAANKLTIPSYTQDNTTYKAEGANDLMWFACDETLYDKRAKEIAASMQHACSWITIKIAGDAVTSDNWKLNSLVVKNLAHTGSVTCGKSAATWNIAADAAKADETYYSNTTGATFSKTAAKFENQSNNFIVLPQTPTDLEVTYTYVSDAANNISITETKSVPLKYDDADTAWQSGEHYIYNVTITATEILIDPVAVDWTAYDGNNIEKTVDEN